MKEIYWLEVWIVQTAPWNSVLYGSSFICVVVSTASWKVKFCENVGNVWIIYETDPPIQDITNFQL